MVAALLGACNIPQPYRPKTASTCYLRTEANVLITQIDGVALTYKDLDLQHAGGFTVDSGTHVYYLSIGAISMNRTVGNFTFTLDPDRIYRVAVYTDPSDKETFYVTILDHSLTFDTIKWQIPFKIKTNDPLGDLLHKL